MRKMVIGLLIVGTVLTGCGKKDNPLDNPCSSESIKLEPSNYATYECGGPTAPDGNFYPNEEEEREKKDSYY